MPDSNPLGFVPRRGQAAIFAVVGVIFSLGAFLIMPELVDEALSDDPDPKVWMFLGTHLVLGGAGAALLVMASRAWTSRPRRAMGIILLIVAAAATVGFVLIDTGVIFSKNGGLAPVHGPKGIAQLLLGPGVAALGLAMVLGRNKRSQPVS
jgi:hypothetical protein